MNVTTNSRDADAILDDCSESGVVKTKKKKLVNIPFLQALAKSGTGSYNFYKSWTSSTEHANGQIHLISLTAAENQNVILPFSFRGTALGLAYSANSTNRSFSVIIDGIVYKAGDTSKQPTSWRNNTIISEGSYVEVIDDNLPDGSHYAELVFQGTASGASSWTLFGMAVSEDAGYKLPVQNCWYIGTTSTLQTAFKNLNTLTINKIFRSVSKFTIYNASANAETVTFGYGATEGSATVLMTWVIVAGQSVEFNFSGIPVALDSTFYQFKCSSDSVATVSIFGRQ